MPPPYHRGRVVNVQDLLKRKVRSYVRHGPLAYGFPVADDKVYFAPEDLDCGNQGSCGSCHLCSAVKVCSKALVRAGTISEMLAWQYGMDCHNCGGCNGGDEGETIDYIKTHGYPVTSAYGEYQARSSQCKTPTGPLFKILDYGYCDPGAAANGVGDTQLIKNCIKAMGPVSVAGAAGGDWDSLGPDQVISGSGRGVNHAIMLVGWDDSKQAWAMENQWGEWGYKINGKGGRAYIKYGADAIGTEAIWVNGGAPMPPTPPWVFALDPGMREQEPPCDDCGKNGGDKEIDAGSGTHIHVHIHK